MKVLFASQNPGKVKEAKQLFGDIANIEIVSPADIQLKDIDVAEDANSFVANALLKAKAFAIKSNLVTIADDSGLSVNVLDGFPGIRSKRFAGLDKLDDRFQMIIDLVKGKDRSAEFVTALCLYDPRTNTHTCVEGRLPGSIAYQEKGTEGFEYDKIFIPEGYTQTVAELGMKVKNQLSARRKALEKLKPHLAVI